VERSRCVTRKGGRPGDLVYVTGTLGGSIGGKHLEFVPRVTEARWLTENFTIHAMMDLSDGLGADLPRLARASKTGFEIFENQLPCSRGASTQEAISAGEDYELLFTLSPRDSETLEKSWRKKFPKLRLTRIGSLNSRASTLNLPRGHDHFA
jgi:thiamine-monophosphate kinase